MTDLIIARYPERRLHYINKGIGGNHIVQLFDRWQDDVLCHRPDWLSVKIGINDLHLTLFNPTEKYPPNVYEENYRVLLTKVRKQLPKTKLILIDPFYISTDRFTDNRRGQVLKLLPQYLNVVRLMVKEFKTLHVKTHEAFLKQLRYREADRLCPEPVHPNSSGHTIIAHEFLKVINW